MARHHEHVIRIVGVEELVVARGLVCVLCRHDAHVEGEILRAEQSLREVDHVVVQDERIEARAVEGELRPRCVPGVPLAGLAAALFRHLGRGGEVAVHGVLRRTQFGRWDHFWHNAPAVGVPTLLQLGCQRRHDGRLTPGAANMVVPRAFARRGPFEIPDRVGHFSSIGVSSFLPFQTLASPRRTPTASRARASPNHSPFSQRRFPLRSRAGTSAGRRPPDRARRLPSGSRSWSVPCNRARVAPGRWSSSRHASWPHRCTMSSET